MHGVQLIEQRYMYLQFHGAVIKYILVKKTSLVRS